MKVMTDWYKKRPPIIISKKAGKKEYEYDVDEFLDKQLNSLPP